MIWHSIVGVLFVALETHPTFPQSGLARRSLGRIHREEHGFSRRPRTSGAIAASRRDPSGGCTLDPWDVNPADACSRTPPQYLCQMKDRRRAFRYALPPPSSFVSPLSLRLTFLVEEHSILGARVFWLEGHHSSYPTTCQKANWVTYRQDEANDWETSVQLVPRCPSLLWLQWKIDTVLGTYHWLQRLVWFSMATMLPSSTQCKCRAIGWSGLDSTSRSQCVPSVGPND